MSQKDLAALTPALEWTQFFIALGWQKPEDVNVGQPEFFKEVNENFRFYGTTLIGAKELQPR